MGKTINNGRQNCRTGCPPAQFTSNNHTTCRCLGSIFSLLFLISLVFPLAFSSFVALLEFSEPTSPQVFPGNEQAGFVRHHAALTAGVVIIRAHEQVLPAVFDFRALARHIFSTNPQELVSSADAVSTLLIHRYDVDGVFQPFSCLVSFQHVNLDREIFFCSIFSW